MLYAFFMFWYFSVDWLSGRKGTILREICHAIAIMILGLYVVTFVTFVLGAEISFFLPDILQTYYWTAWAIIFLVLEAKLAVFAMSQSEHLNQWFARADKFVYGLASIIKEGFEGLASTIMELLEWLKRKLLNKRRKP